MQAAAEGAAEGTPPLPEGEEGTPPLSSKTPMPEPQSPSPESDDGAQEDWVPGRAAQAKKRRRKGALGSAKTQAGKSQGTPPESAEDGNARERRVAGEPAPDNEVPGAAPAAAQAGAVPSRRKKPKLQALVVLPSLLSVAQVKASPLKRALAKVAPAGSSTDPTSPPMRTAAKKATLATTAASTTVASTTAASISAASTRRVPSAVETKHEALLGVWTYGSNLTYEIHIFYDKLFYQEFNQDDSLFCQGELLNADDGMRMIAMLRDVNRSHIGTIRLMHYFDEERVGHIVSNFQEVGSKDWTEDTDAKQAPTPAAIAAAASAASQQPKPLLEGTLGVMYASAGLPGGRHFVLHADRLDCYKNPKAAADGLQPLECFWNDELQDLKDGSMKKSVNGESIKIFFIDPSFTKSLPAAIKKACSSRASAPKAETPAFSEAKSPVRSKAVASKAAAKAKRSRG